MGKVISESMQRLNKLYEANGIDYNKLSPEDVVKFGDMISLMIAKVTIVREHNNEVKNQIYFGDYVQIPKESNVNAEDERRTQSQEILLDNESLNESSLSVKESISETANEENVQ